MAKEVRTNPNPTLPTPAGQLAPRTVLGAKRVELALVSYTDEAGRTVTQLAIVGENNVNLLESRDLGITKEATQKGLASGWLRDGIFKAMGRKVKKEG